MRTLLIIGLLILTGCSSYSDTVYMHVIERAQVKCTPHGGLVWLRYRIYNVGAGLTINEVEAKCKDKTYLEFSYKSSYPITPGVDLNDYPN